MYRIILFVFVLLPAVTFAQSKSVNRFRSDFKENSNLFFYSSTLKMLNSDNNPEFAGILDGIEEIRVLNYTKSAQKFDNNDITSLKNGLQKENYNTIMMINEKGNTVNVYGRDKNGRMAGLVAIVENTESLVVIDLIGSVDIKKFMELKNKLEDNSVKQL
ncbi:MAG TPA: DUF4252 domain-containing protein [Bacteroidales bacterium]|nr:DUF4252 domain-containing protein [Bacteroidales bacterium]